MSNAPTAAVPAHDAPAFTYRPRTTGGTVGRCRLRIFAAHGPALADGYRRVVLATDLGDDNPGPSVTSGAEDVATAAILAFGLDPARCAFVEHYDGRVGNTAPLGRRDGVEDFDRVTFTFVDDGMGGARATRPAWSPLRKAALEAMVGGLLP